MECFDLEDKINRVILNEAGNQFLNAFGGGLKRGVYTLFGRSELNQTQKIRELFNYKFDQKSREVLGSRKNTLDGIKIYDVYRLTLNIFNEIIKQIGSSELKDAIEPIMTGIKEDYNKKITEARSRSRRPRNDREFEFYKDTTIHGFKKNIFKIINFNYKGISDSEADLKASDDPIYNLARDTEEEKVNCIKILRMFTTLKNNNVSITYEKAIQKIMLASNRSEKITKIMNNLKNASKNRINWSISPTAIMDWMNREYDINIQPSDFSSV